MNTDMNVARYSAWALGLIAGFHMRANSTQLLPTTYNHLPVTSLLRSLVEHMERLSGINSHEY